MVVSATALPSRNRLLLSKIVEVGSRRVRSPVLSVPTSTGLTLEFERTFPYRQADVRRLADAFEVLLNPRW